MFPIAALDDILLGLMRGLRGGSHGRNPVMHAFKGTLPFFLPYVAFEAATAPRGEAGSKATGATAGFVASTAAYGLTDHVVKQAMLGSFGRRRMIASAIGKRTLGAAGSGMTKALFGIPGMIAGTAAAWAVDEFVTPRVAAAHKAVLRESRLLRHFNAGGDYEDTQVAYTMRQRAVQEMGQSLLNARQYLGKEALMFHE